MFSEIFFPKKVEFAKLTTNKSLRPGEFAFDGSFFVGTIPKDNYKGKVIILINEDTPSAAEFQVIAFQKSPNVTVVGSATSGADGNISWIPLPFGYSTAFSAIGIYYLDGERRKVLVLFLM